MQHQGGFDLVSLLPFLIATIPVAVIAFHTAPRKGKNRALHTILGLIPGVNYLALVYLISFTDKVVIDKLDAVLSALEKK